MLEIGPTLPQHHHVGEVPRAILEGWGGERKQQQRCTAVCQRWKQPLAVGRRGLRKHEEKRACGT